jgi:hypothetical protein
LPQTTRLPKQACRRIMNVCTTFFLSSSVDRTSWPSSWHTYFIFGRSWVQISVRKLAILNEVYCGFPQTSRQMLGTLNQATTDSFHTLFASYSPIIISFKAIVCDTDSIVKNIIKKKWI